MTMLESMLTTTDNPFDPFTEYNAWLACDFRLGYHTPSLLARVTVSSHDLSSFDESVAIEDAIDEIVSENVSGVHIKVERDVDLSNYNP